MKELHGRREVLREMLEAEAGNEPQKDRFHCGYIAAVNDILNMSFEEVELKETE